MVKLAKLLDRLETLHGTVASPPARGPLELVLWENAAYLVPEARRSAVFRALKKETRLKPAGILAARPERLLEIAREGGMHPEKRVERWMDIAQRVQDEHGGELERVLELPTAKALKALEAFPAIGRPGAEKILMLCGRYDELALESNGLRTLLRLGYGEKAKSYDKSYRNARAALEGELRAEPAWLARAHLLLRRHGEAVCRNSAPVCEECPLTASCAWYAADG